MNLHRSGSEPDWAEVHPSEYNIWQKIAAKTNGIVTPGNFVSTLGLIGVVHGLYEFSQGNKLAGAIEIGAGFAADAVDGFAADKSKTKSPLGKGVDAGFDKVKIGATLFALYGHDVIPMATVAIVGAQNTANTVFTFLAMRRGQEMQPEEAGKKTMIAQCGGLAIAAVGHSVSPGNVSVAFDVIGNGAAIVGTFYPGLKATASYASAAFGTMIELSPELELGFEPEQ